LEKYNATVKRTLPKFLKIWHRFLTNWSSFKNLNHKSEITCWS
jgi:hypothetical protein